MRLVQERMLTRIDEVGMRKKQKKDRGKHGWCRADKQDK